MPADLADPASVSSLKAAVEDRLGQPSILINAAGVFGPIELVWNTDPDDWVRTLMVNTVAPYLTCRAFAEGMIGDGWGRIINVTSAAALHEPGPINSAYGTSKAALNQFTRHLAAELAGTGVTANVIHPGDVKTEMWADIRGKAEGLGPEAARYQDWADWVERTGGDDPEKASDLIEALHRRARGGDQRPLPLDQGRAAGADPELGGVPSGRSLGGLSRWRGAPRPKCWRSPRRIGRPAPAWRRRWSTGSSTSSAPGCCAPATGCLPSAS